MSVDSISNERNRTWRYYRRRIARNHTEKRNLIIAGLRMGRRLETIIDVRPPEHLREIDGHAIQEQTSLAESFRLPAEFATASTLLIKRLIDSTITLRTAIETNISTRVNACLDRCIQLRSSARNRLAL